MSRSLASVAVEPAEFRMRFQGLLERAASESEPAAGPALGPYLTISREADSGGAEVARRVGERLGWPVLDRELVQQLAANLELEPRLLELMDETKIDWFSETMLNLFESRLVLQDSYVSMLGRAIALAAYDGPVIIVGRAANLILPPEYGLRVRVVAPRRLRLQALAEREGLSEKEASSRLDGIDRSRIDFVRRHFHADPDECDNYDLVVDAARFGLGGTVDLLIRAMELRGLAG